MNNIKTALYGFIIIITFSSCFINKDRDNSNDPKADNYLSPSINAWKIKSWTAASPVVETYTHEAPYDKPNGAPSFLAIADNDKLHVFSYLVEAVPNDGYYYTVKEPDDDAFNQTPVIFLDIRPKSFANPLSLVLLSNDVPLITYTNDNNLCFLQNNGLYNSWSSPESLYDVGDTISQVFSFMLSSDPLFDVRIYYLQGSTMYETLRTASNTINPPATFLTGVGTSSIIKYSADDLVFIYSDTSKQKIYHRTLKDATVTEIWSTTDVNTAISSITAILDSSDNIHVCFTTSSPVSGETSNPEYFSIKYITNSGGTWAEKASINGNEDAGPIYFPVSIALTQDSIGNDHLHMVYTLWKLPMEAQVWYAYFDNETWNIADEQLDPDHTSTFLACMPSIVSDSHGDLHVVYSWAPTELSRTLMYLKGFSAASLNK